MKLRVGAIILKTVLGLPVLCTWLGAVVINPALIVNDPSGIATVTTNLSARLTAAGYTVSTNVGVPAGSLASYKQIWDVRFNNTTPLTPSDVTAYMAYLNGGGSLFVMGENLGFATRNNSIIGLVSTAGGGTITLVTPNNAQTIQAPFTGPNAITTYTFPAAAGAPSPGTGAYITKDANGIGAGLIFGPGNLANAPTGSLAIVFDLNFMDLGVGATAQALLDNMIAYLAAPTPVGSQPVPTLSEWAIILLTGGLLVLGASRIRHSDRLLTN
jgi:hypothetical protein